MGEKIKTIINFIYETTFIFLLVCLSLFIGLYYLYLEIPESIRNNVSIEGIHIGKIDENISKE